MYSLLPLFVRVEISDGAGSTDAHPKKKVLVAQAALRHLHDQVMSKKIEETKLSDYAIFGVWRRLLEDGQTEAVRLRVEKLQGAEPPARRQGRSEAKSAKSKKKESNTVDVGRQAVKDLLGMS